MGLPSWAPTAARGGLKLVIAGCLALFNYVFWYWVTDAYYVQMAAIFNNWGLKYPRSGSLGVKSLDAYDTGMVALMWLPLLAAAYATLVLQAIPKGAVPRAYTRLRRQIRIVLAWEAPPRRFFTWWCGGMSVRDLIVVIFMVAANLWYFIWYYRSYDRQLDAVAAAGVAFPEPRWRLMLERVAIIFGIMMWPNIWMLFFPIPQSSFLQTLTGLQYTEMIRYHRWVGQITLVVLSLHGWLYYLYWALKQEFWYNFSNWGTLSSINYLAGTISYLFALVLWSSSLSWVRRRFFEVFYRCHIVCFLGFTLFAYMHYFWSWSYFLPGIMLYGVDLVLRAGQLSQTTLVTAASVDNEAGVATIQLKTSKDITSACPVHELFLMVPSISRWQWHPITVAGTEPDASGSGSIITLSIKRYGKWTKELLERLQRRQPLALRVSAPQVPKHCLWEGCTTLVLLGGGVGATPLLALLREMIAERRADPKAASSQPGRVHFLWASRQPREICMLDGAVLEAARSSDGWLTLELFSTRPMPAAADAAEEGVHGAKEGGLGKSDSGRASSEGSQELKAEDSFGKDASQPSMAVYHGVADPAVLSSPFFHKFARVIQPQAVGSWHLALVYVLVWVGTFLGTVLGGAYVGEAYTYFDTSGISVYPNTLYWKVGMVWFFTQAIMMIGVPYILAVLPLHVWRYWRATRNPDSAEVLPLAPPHHPTGHGSGCQLVGGMLTAGGESGLEILSGRPAMRDALLAVGKDLTRSDTVGVFVGGPEPMTRQVQLETASLNDWGQPGPHYAFRAMAHML